MIAHVSGVVAEKFGSSIVIDVHGVGYEVAVPLGDYEKALLDQPVKLYTFHHVREQAEELFGFSSLAGRKLFELLITVQGVGPKAALAILSLGSTEQVRNAVANSDSVYITRATGVGKKTAERVVVDLADKVGLPTYYQQTAAVQTELNTNDEALEALISLGYTLNDGIRALEGVPSELTTAARVTQALKKAG